MQEWAPDYLQGFLEKMLGGRGASIRELAVFAGTLEDLIRKEEEGHLLQAYASQVQPSNASLAPKEAFQVLQTYMMIYMLGGNWTAQMATKVDRLTQLFELKVSHWHDTLDWLRRMLETKADDGSEVQLDFQGALRIVGDIGDRYNSFNDAECGRLKGELVSTESAKPGRVRLVDFYKKGLHGAWEFNEKIDFLRDIGVLDESDPKTPLVILPNYVQARTNCLAVSNYYAVCCRNECEPLMERLEGEIVGATARPSQISKIVSRLSSATISAPRTLPKSLMQRLQDVASHHGGEVPIHGRLFSQWMHHAFPRECPYPHVAGTTSQLTADEWMLKMGQEDSKMTEEEMLQTVDSDTCRLLPKGVDCGHSRSAPEPEGEDDELPWDSQEELLVVHSQPSASAAKIGLVSPVRDIAFFFALASAIYGTCWALKSTSLGRRASQCAGVPLSAKSDKCCV
jgi:diadenosine tetraphosphatase ApaH/serine/threonine PP2A family protein phosphatase